MQELFDAITSNDSAATQTALEKAGNSSAILLSLYYGRRDLAQMLVDRGAKLTFAEACAFGDGKRVSELMKSDASLANSFSDDGFPAAALAIFFRNSEIARELIERGADVNAAARNPQKVAAIHAAATTGNREMVQMLLDRGADPNQRQQAGYVALHTAALHGDREMAEMLLRAGADPRLANDEGTTAEDLARQKGHEAFVDWLRTMY
jgi:ankyrin repeat protein